MSNVNGAANVEISPAPRPYRSHKIPACDFCRRRKSRCTQDLVGQPCLLCRMHGATCSRLGTSADQRSRSHPSSFTSKRKGQGISSNRHKKNDIRRQSSPSAHETSPRSSTAREAPLAESRLAMSFSPKDTGNQSSHIVGPAMAGDAQVLERYMSPVDNAVVPYARPNPYSVYSHDPRDPVVYTKVPRQRNIIPSGNGTAGFKQYEVMEKIVDPLGPELFRIYFDNIHPPFPILDEKTVLETYRQDGLPYTLVCEIYAVSLIMWKTSRNIAATGRPTPDVRYMWNLTVSAMNDDFLAPDFSTVLACILDLLGRPITSMTYNAVNIGRVVALSQSLGLNRNPSRWDLNDRQKSLRIRTWWGVLIHDQCLSHGTPPHIHRSQWDVPLPDSDSLLSRTATSRREDVSHIQVQGSYSFVALCQLTAILSNILPLIYSLQIQPLEHAFKALRQHETALDRWEEDLPHWLSADSASFERKAPGALNLLFCCLVVRMYLCRMGLLEIRRSDESDVKEEKLYYQARCRKASRMVIDFVTALKKDEITVFWLPYTAYHFTSAVTLILRCALEADNFETAQECVASAKKLLSFLRKMKNEVNWDLTDICLGHCEAVVEKLSDSHNLDTWRNPQSRQQSMQREFGQNFPEGHTQNIFTRFYQGPHLEHGYEGGCDGPNSSSSNTNPGFFVEAPGISAMSVAMADYTAIPELWQIPYLDA